MMNPPTTQADTFQLKLKPINKLPELPDNRPETVYAAWQQDQRPEMGAKLLKSLQPSIEHAVRKWTGDTNPIAMGQARSLLIDALPRYEPGKAQLSTFVDRQLQPLQRWKSRKNLGVKVQTGMVQELQQLQRAQIELEDDLGRSPSFEELADRTGINMDRLARLRKMRHPSISESMATDSDGGQSFTEDQGVTDDANFWQKTVYHSLNSMDQVVLQHTTGLYNAEILSNQAIAKKLKITPGAVSQRKAKIQAMLDAEASQF